MKCASVHLEMPSSYIHSNSQQAVSLAQPITLMMGSSLNVSHNISVELKALNETHHSLSEAPVTSSAAINTSTSGNSMDITADLHDKSSKVSFTTSMDTMNSSVSREVSFLTLNSSNSPDNYDYFFRSNSTSRLDLYNSTEEIATLSSVAEWRTLLMNSTETDSYNQTTESFKIYEEDEFTGLHSIPGPYDTDGSSHNLAPLGLVLIISLTIIGNLMVCLAVKLDKRLHSMTYFFFVSMGILHIMMAGIVMPPATIIVLAGEFQYSEELCKGWLTFDFFFCNCTCLHLAFINMDTFLRLKDPLKHGSSATSCSLLLWIGASWVISFVQSLAQFMLSQADNGVLNNGICFIPDKNFVILGFFFSFLIPTIIALAFYGLCIHELQVLKAGKFLDESDANTYPCGSQESIPDDDLGSDSSSGMSDVETEVIQEHVQLAVVTNLQHKGLTSCVNPNHQPAGTQPTIMEETTSFCQSSLDEAVDYKSKTYACQNPAYNQDQVASADQSSSCTLLLREDSGHQGEIFPEVRINAEHDHASPDEALRQEVALSHLMFLLLLLSITLWLPYSVSNLVYGVCEPCHRNMELDEVMTFKWLAYSSALIGPWIYIRFSEALRESIWSIIACQFCRKQQ